MEHMEHDDVDDPEVRMAVSYLSHAIWMVRSRQYRGTVRAYMNCQRPSPIRDKALAMLDRGEKNGTIRTDDL
jgi:hypothetical protein